MSTVAAATVRVRDHAARHASRCLALNACMGRTASRIACASASALGASVRFLRRTRPTGIPAGRSIGRTRTDLGNLANRRIDPYITVRCACAATSSNLTSIDIVVTAASGRLTPCSRNCASRCVATAPSFDGNVQGCSAVSFSFTDFLLASGCRVPATMKSRSSNSRSNSRSPPFPGGSRPIPSRRIDRRRHQPVGRTPAR